MLNWIWIGLGGAIGSILRYSLGSFVQRLAHNPLFPYGTLAVNLLGCFVIGFLAQVAEAHGMFTAAARGLIFVGLLGGFTTFSTFGNETFNLLREGATATGIVNVAAHVLLGLAAVWLGRALAAHL